MPTPTQKIDGLSIKPSFLSVHLDGKRFGDHSLPVSLTEDLRAYEQCIICVAKHLYKKETGKKRIPKNFADGWALKIQDLEKGSTLVNMIVAAFGSILPLNQTYFEEARNLVSNVIIAASSGFMTPDDFPNECFEYFEGIGKNLRAGESMDFCIPQQKGSAKLTPDVRKILIDRQIQKTQESLTLVGFINELDTKSNHFRLLDSSGRTIQSIPCKDAQIRASVKELLGTDHGIKLDCTAVCDSAGRILSVDEPSNYERIHHYKLVLAIEKICCLEEGWLEDGDGPAYKGEDWEWLSQAIKETFPDGIAYPDVCPTAEGTISFTWNTKTYICTVEFYSQNQKCEILILEKDNFREIEKDLPCSTSQEWYDIFKYLNTYLA